MRNRDVFVSDTGLHHPRNLDQKLRPHQVSVRVIHRLEVVEIQEQQAERVLQLLGAFDLLIQNQMQIPDVEQMREIVEVGEILHLGELAQISKGETEVPGQVRGGPVDILRNRADEQQPHAT